MPKFQLACDQSVQQLRSTGSIDLQNRHMTSSLLPKIYDQQFYEHFTALTLSLARQAGLAPEAILLLASQLLKAKGLDGLLASTFCNESSSPIQLQDRLTLLSGNLASPLEQAHLLERLQQEFQTQRQKIVAQKLLHHYMAAEAEHLAPLANPQPQTRKHLLTQRHTAKCSRQQNLLPNFEARKQYLELSPTYCYEVVGRFKHLKTLFGHAEEDDFDSFPPVFNAIFDRSGRIIITAGQEGRIKLWSRDNGQLLGFMKISFSYIIKIEVSKCNRYLLSTTFAGMHIYDLLTLQKVTAYNGYIIDIVQAHNGKEPVFMFCETTNLIVVTESTLKTCRGSGSDLREQNILVFKLPSSGETEAAPNHEDPNKQVLMISVSRNNEYVVLGLQGGDILLFHLKDLFLQPPSNGSEPRPLPLRHKIKAHKDGILEVVWSIDSGFFITGGKEGTCLIWQYNEGTAPTVVKKLLPKKRHKQFACTYVCWNCTSSHFAVGFMEVEDEEGMGQGDGELLIYDWKAGAVTLTYSSDIGPITSICSLQTHPHFPNIILICEGNGRVTLFDIFLKVRVNVFHEKGFHTAWPQLPLTPSDSHFSPDGFAFVVSSEYGSISLYGYDCPTFYLTSPHQQFFRSQFIRGGDMQFGGTICSIKTESFQHTLNALHPLKILAQTSWCQNKVLNAAQTQINSLICPDQTFLDRIQFNVSRNMKHFLTYKAIYDEAQQNRSLMMAEDRIKRANTISHTLTVKTKQFQTYKYNTIALPQNEESPDKQMEPTSKRGRRLRKLVSNIESMEAEISEHEGSGRIKSEEYEAGVSQDEEDIQDLYAEESEMPAHNRRIRHSRPSRLRRQPPPLEEPYESRLPMRASRRTDEFEQSDSQYDSGSHGSKTRKRIKRDQSMRRQSVRIAQSHSQVVATQAPRLRRAQLPTEHIPICMRCESTRATFKCRMCRSRSFCDNCKTKVGLQNFKCFECVYESNSSQKNPKYTDEHYKITERKDSSYIPQIDDEVRFFFQGYQEFIFENLRVLSKAPKKKFDGFKLLPHIEHPNLRQTPLCRVVNVTYYFPCAEQRTEYMPRGQRRDTDVKQIQSGVSLVTVGPEPVQFEVLFVSGCSHLVREELFEYLESKECRQRIELNSFVEFKNSKYQIVNVSPIEKAFPTSQWKRVSIWDTDANTKCLRGNRTSASQRVNAWQLISDANRPPFTTDLKETYKVRLLSEISRFIDEGGQDFAFFYEFVDTELYDTYSKVVEHGSCIKIIEKRLKSNYYRSNSNVLADLERILNNSIAFNRKDSVISEWAEVLTSRMKRCLSEAAVDPTIRKSRRQLMNTETSTPPSLPPTRATVKRSNLVFQQEQSVNWKSDSQGAESRPRTRRTALNEDDPFGSQGPLATRRRTRNS